MLKLSTPVDTVQSKVKCSLSDSIMLLGSCFADEMACRMTNAGFRIVSNPFGTLYNPASIASAVQRLDSAKPFGPEDCVRMGAGSSLVCSFEHHSSFARPEESAFLDNANARLKEAADFWKSCSKVIVTLGTAFVWEHEKSGIVSNCLKRDAREFRHYMLSVDRCASLLRQIVSDHPEKDFIFTVSPIRHLSQGAHLNTLSKAALHMAVHRLMEVLEAFETSGLVCAGVDYFPAWEIMYDELRDYRFYSEDLVHPSKTAADIIWERFLLSSVPVCDINAVRENEKASRRAAHRSIRY